MAFSFNIILDYSKLKKRIKQNEGFSTKPYKDQLGFLTVGYGHLIKANEKHLLIKQLSKKELERLFLYDFNKALEEYNGLLCLYAVDKKDAELLIEMTYQMGAAKVLGFKSLLKKITKREKSLACFEMMNSLWYTQTPHRVKNIITNYLGK